MEFIHNALWINVLEFLIFVGDTLREDFFLLPGMNRICKVPKKGHIWGGGGVYDRRITAHILGRGGGVVYDRRITIDNPCVLKSFLKF